MTSVSRRRFLQITTVAGAMAVLENSIEKAAAIEPHREHHSIKDVEHVIFLMQENRSFDHYFGTMRGVRGYGDPHPARLPNGNDVFHQPHGESTLLPYRPDVEDLGMKFFVDTSHEWNTTHAAFNKGNYDGWVAAKTPATMMHYERKDIPWHYALADAFTVCDSYHCSLLGPTDPNRYYMFTGWDGNDGTGGGPDLWNDEAGYGWTTYPELLAKAGVSWKVYQDQGDGLDKAGSWGWTKDAYIGNYGDNSLLYFHQYQDARPGDPLYEGARRGTNAKSGEDFFAHLAADVKNGTLPQVSWICAPQAYCEHPNFPPNYGAWYLAQVLDTLTSNPEVWSRTALFVMYDENDGLFDHVVPPHPPTPLIPGKSTVDTTNEYYAGAKDVPGHFGLGIRVPMFVISPWSTGGWVDSEMFDATSMIRFVEERFGVRCPSISDWRRTVCGDLTSAFDFEGGRRAHDLGVSTSGYRPTDNLSHPDYVPPVPSDQSMPVQEPGIRRARPIDYRVRVHAEVRHQHLDLSIANEGRLGVHLQLRGTGMASGPYTYTVGARKHVSDSIAFTGPHDVALHGPNGFYRRLAGTGAAHEPLVEFHEVQGGHVELSVRGHHAGDLHVRDAYTGRSVPLRHDGRHRFTTVDGWYDLTVSSSASPAWTQVFAGHLENGRPSISDPQLGN